MPVVRFEARERFPVKPEELWPLVSDTHRLNRAMGLPFMDFAAEPLETGGSRVTGTHRANASILAFLGQILPLGPKRVADPTLLRLLPRFTIARWIEHPFEFAAPRRYSVYRDYFESPLGLFPFRTFRGGVELIPQDDGITEVCTFADIESRNPQGALVTRFIVGPRSCDLVIAQCPNFVRFLRGEAPTPFPDLVLEIGAPLSEAETKPVAAEEADGPRPVAPVASPVSGSSRARPAFRTRWSHACASISSARRMMRSSRCGRSRWPIGGRLIDGNCSPHSCARRRLASWRCRGMFSARGAACRVDRRRLSPR